MAPLAAALRVWRGVYCLAMHAASASLRLTARVRVGVRAAAGQQFRPGTGSLERNVAKLFTEKVKIFGEVQFTQVRRRCELHLLSLLLSHRLTQRRKYIPRAVGLGEMISTFTAQL